MKNFTFTYKNFEIEKLNTVNFHLDPSLENQSFVYVSFETKEGSYALHAFRAFNGPSFGDISSWSAFCYYPGEQDYTLENDTPDRWDLSLELFHALVKHHPQVRLRALANGLFM